jgi:hypothetical protein
VLKSFSWALLIGVVVGTYSTIYIASPVMLWWEAWKTGKRTALAGAPVSSDAAASAEAASAGSAGVTPQMLAAAGVSTKQRKKR